MDANLKTNVKRFRFSEERKQIIIDILKDRDRLAAMRKGALSLSRPDAADAVAAELLALAGDNSK